MPAAGRPPARPGQRAGASLSLPCRPEGPRPPGGFRPGGTGPFRAATRGEVTGHWTAGETGSQGSAWFPVTHAVGGGCEVAVPESVRRWGPGPQQRWEQRWEGGAGRRVLKDSALSRESTGRGVLAGCVWGEPPCRAVRSWASASIASVPMGRPLTGSRRDPAGSPRAAGVKRGLRGFLVPRRTQESRYVHRSLTRGRALHAPSLTTLAKNCEPSSDPSEALSLRWQRVLPQW